MDGNLEELHAVACRMRAAIEAARDAGEAEGTFMVDFPHGQCDDASGMLASYLEDCGFGSWELVVGHRPPKFHAWLERDGVILDITADQFDDEGHPPVVVTRDRAWHAQFDEVSRRRARPRLNEIEHTSTREGLMRFHEAVRGRLPDTPDVE